MCRGCAAFARDTRGRVGVEVCRGKCGGRERPGLRAKQRGTEDGRERSILICPSELLYNMCRGGGGAPRSLTEREPRARNDLGSSHSVPGPLCQAPIWTAAHCETPCGSGTLDRSVYLRPAGYSLTRERKAAQVYRCSGRAALLPPTPKHWGGERCLRAFLKRKPASERPAVRREPRFGAPDEDWRDVYGELARSGPVR